MPRLQITHRHRVTPDEARRRLEQLQGELEQRYGLAPTWTSPNEVRMRRSGASGTLRIEPEEIRVHIDLPFLLTPLKGEIERLIRQELGVLFAG